MVRSKNADVIELPLVGGHRRARDTAWAANGDYLADPPALLHWARRVSLVDEAEFLITDRWDPSLAYAALAASGDVREALHVVLLATIDEVLSDTGTVAAALERLHSRSPQRTTRLVLEPERATAAQLAVGVSSWSRPRRRRRGRASDGRSGPQGAAPRCRRLRLGLPGPQPQRLAPVVPDGRLRNNGQGPPPHRTSARRPGALSEVATC